MHLGQMRADPVKLEVLEYSNNYSMQCVQQLKVFIKKNGLWHTALRFVFFFRLRLRSFVVRRSSLGRCRWSFVRSFVRSFVLWRSNSLANGLSASLVLG